MARALGAPLDVFVVRKLGVPGYEELAMGAVASGGLRVLNDNNERVRLLIERLLPRLKGARSCACGQALEHAVIS